MTDADDERKKRLAEALRENLRRRKTQARGGQPIRPDRDRDDKA